LAGLIKLSCAFAKIEKAVTVATKNNFFMVLFFTIKKLNHLKKNLAHRWRSRLVFNRAGLKYLILLGR
jgi:hypothetical protein